MTVAAWEFYSLAAMLVGSHGDAAEEEAARRLEEARERDDRGQMVVWTEVSRKIAKVRTDTARRGEG